MRINIPVLVLGGVLMFGLVGCSRQQSDWQKARETNTTESYEHFLKEYPSGEFTAQAQARLKELGEESDWQKARDADTSEAYQAFLKQHPEGKWTEEARIRVENFTLAQAPETAAPGRSNPAGGTNGSGSGAPPVAGAPPSAAAKPAATPHTGVPNAGSTAGGAGHAAAPSAAGASSGQADHGTKGGTEKHPSTAAPAGSYGVQLGAFKSGAAAAHKHWARLQKEFPTLLAGLKPKVAPLKTGQGTVYRLQAFGVAKKRARTICKDLKAKSQACIVVRAARR